MNEFITELIDVSPPVALWLALNFILMFAKKTPHIPYWTIPWIAFAIGGSVYPLLSDPGKVGFAVHSPKAAQIVTGILIGGAAIGGNQLFKQTIKRFGFSPGGDTEQFVKEKANEPNPNTPGVPPVI